MPRFFVEEIKGKHMVLTGDNAAHIAKSLRMRIGEVLTLSDANGIDCDAKIIRISDGLVDVEVLEERCNQSEPTLSVTLYQAFPKVGKFETIVQKAVELGVTRIVPIITSRCVSRPDKKSQDKKVERYNKIALEAAKQSGRGIIPTVGKFLTYKEVLSELSEFEDKILFYEEGGERVEQILSKSASRLAIIIGSEGGFSAEEVAQSKRVGVKVGTLGPRILRCETAPIAALSILMYYTENM